MPAVSATPSAPRVPDVIVHVDRLEGRRRVTAICEVVPPAMDGGLDPPAVRTLATLGDDGFTQVATLSRGRR